MMNGNNSYEQALEAYLSAVREVRHNQKLSREEKLTKLLTPLIDLYEKITPNFRDRHDFADENTISLEEELDLPSLEHISDAWRILRNLKTARFYYVDARDKIIEVNYKKFLPQSEQALTQQGDYETTSIRHLYKAWLPFVDSIRITSKDLLDQILVCYTIKRAQNGDENAWQRLFSLYRDRALSRQTFEQVMKLLYARLNPKERAKKDDEPDLETKFPLTPYHWEDEDTCEEFQQNVNNYLLLIIKGFSTAKILDLLRTGDDLGTPIPREIGDIYLYYFGEFIPEIINRYLKFLENTVELIKDPINEERVLNLAESILKVLEYLPVNQAIKDKSLKNLEYLRSNPGERLESEAIARLSSNYFAIASVLPDRVASFIETLFDPSRPISSDFEFMKDTEKQKIAKVQSFCYRPEKMGPKRNLTTWLFGGSKSPEYGKLYQALTDHYMKDLRGRPEDVRTYDEDTDMKFTTLEERNLIERSFESNYDLQALASRAGITDFDLAFLLDRQSFDLEEIAEKYKMTENQVRYKEQTLLKKVKKTEKK